MDAMSVDVTFGCLEERCPAKVSSPEQIVMGISHEVHESLELKDAKEKQKECCTRQVLRFTFTKYRTPENDLIRFVQNVSPSSTITLS